MKARVWFEPGLCTAALFDGDIVIWSDNSGPKAWRGLLDDAHQVAKAAQCMARKGQRLEPWSVVVSRAPKL